MKRGSVSLVVLLACLPLAGFLYSQAHAAAPCSATNDLASQVKIRRDTYGVPHILASSEEAAAFGQGYVTAEDHGTELARLFLRARGEESAHFGEQFAESDLLVKEFGIHEVAEEGLVKSPPLMRMILEAYAGGYDRYLEKHRDEFPDWARPVSGADVLAHARRVVIMEFTMDLRQLSAIGQKAEAVFGPSDPQTDLQNLRGSNMWAIGKERSVTGNALLLGNPHLSWSGSNLFHEIHLTVPGKINISGTTLIGIPGLVLGFNENLGWSHTVNLHSSDNVYELTLDPADNHRYIYEGHSLPMERKQISIQVKTDAGLTPRVKEIFWSHYGPVMKWDQAKAYAFKSANFDEYRFIEQWNMMAKSTNLAEFRRALDMQALPMFNVCYADKQGNIFYIFNGRFPDRPAGMNWSGVIPGDKASTEWNQILPESRLPFLINPPGGYVQNSNSSPWYTNLRAILDRHKYPEDLTPNLNGLRQQLGLEMLDGDKKFLLDDVLRLKFNMKILLADRVKADLIKLARGRTIDGIDLGEAATVLADWDNTVSRESKGSTLFVNFWSKYRLRAHPVYAVEWDERFPASTPHGLGDDQAALQSLAAAVKEAKEKYRSLAIPWGDLHRLRRGNLDVPIGGLTGDFGAFRLIAYRTEPDGKFVAVEGDSYVIAVEFSSTPVAYSIVAYSQTDNPKSPHFNDQSRLFAQEKWKRAWFTEEDINKNLEKSYHP